MFDLGSRYEIWNHISQEDLLCNMKQHTVLTTTFMFTPSPNNGALRTLARNNNIEFQDIKEWFERMQIRHKVNKEKSAKYKEDALDVLLKQISHPLYSPLIKRGRYNKYISVIEELVKKTTAAFSNQEPEIEAEQQIEEEVSDATIVATKSHATANAATASLTSSVATLNVEDTKTAATNASNETGSKVAAPIVGATNHDADSAAPTSEAASDEPTATVASILSIYLSSVDQNSEGVESVCKDDEVLDSEVVSDKNKMDVVQGKNKMAVGLDKNKIGGVKVIADIAKPVVTNDCVTTDPNDSKGLSL